jgi:hypothetical protein
MVNQKLPKDFREFLRLLNDHKIDGVNFEDCYIKKQYVVIDKVPVYLISLQDLKQNKRASARYKDLDDLEHLPE